MSEALRHVAVVRQGSNGLPQAPAEIADEVELFARESGRTGTLHFVPYGGWMARFSLRSNDPRMRAYQEGNAPEPPSEDVWFHQPNPHEGKSDGHGGRQGPFLPLDVLQMGASGVRAFLDRQNTWSGRGEHQSVEQAMKKALDLGDAQKAAFKETMKTDSLHEQRAKRRFRFGIPVVPVGIDLSKET